MNVRWEEIDKFVRSRGVEERPMSETQIRFDDGAAYERMMGVWSRLAGDVFLDWLAPRPGQRWIDIGCGNGAFTELLVQRCAPVEVHGIDPSEAQLSFARSRHTAGIAHFQRGDATALQFDDNSFDAAVMALVIFFVPDPEQGVAEMKRVVKPGGTISAYAWDILEPGGFPMGPMQEELRAMGRKPMLPPRPEVSRMEALRGLWVDAGLTEVATRDITVARTFDDFEDFWASVQIAVSMAQAIREMSADEIAQFMDRLRVRLPADASGRITYTSRANAVTGRVPG
jgi:ubiquinone/menaquinone biosynthesis C-methylase UbiE